MVTSHVVLPLGQLMSNATSFSEVRRASACVEHSHGGLCSESASARVAVAASYCSITEDAWPASLTALRASSAVASLDACDSSSCCTWWFSTI